jgi:hypothetical protein
MTCLHCVAYAVHHNACRLSIIATSKKGIAETHPRRCASSQAVSCVPLLLPAGSGRCTAVCTRWPGGLCSPQLLRADKQCCCPGAARVKLGQTRQQVRPDSRSSASSYDPPSARQQMRATAVTCMHARYAIVLPGGLCRACMQPVLTAGCWTCMNSAGPLQPKATTAVLLAYVRFCLHHNEVSTQVQLTSLRTFNVIWVAAVLLCRQAGASCWPPAGTVCG